MKLSIFTPTHDSKHLRDVYGSIKDQGPTQVKLCECGCGGPTTIAVETRVARGVVKGQPMRFIRGHVNVGRVFSAQHRANIAKAKRGLIPWNKGKVHSPETREKIRQKALGRTPWNMGIPRTEECKRKISLNHADCSGKSNSNYGNGSKIRGDKNPSWRGGISDSPYPQDWTRTLRDAIRQRDRYTCRVCCATPAGTRKLHVHHIDYDKDNCDPKNLVSLCASCHMKTNYNRPEWIKFFNCCVDEERGVAA